MPRSTPKALRGTLGASMPPGLTRAHARLDTATASSLRLSVSGRGDDLQALELRARIENLVRCGPERVVVDVGGLDGVSSMFVRVLADAITSARSQGCVVSTVGLDSAEVLEVLYRAPLDQLVTIDGSAHHRHGAQAQPESSGRLP